MHAWPASEVPALPGKGRDLRIHDTATGGPVTLDPGPVARIYVCGITPYDATHMGHAATYNAFDLVQRVWLDTKRQVHYVQNVTDVDDPLLERAVRDGDDWTALAERETALFREDMTALRMLPPQHYIGAVEAIPGIVPLVERLRDAGAAYELDGDVYFSVESDPHFGEVSDLDAEAMRLLSAERGGDPDRPGQEEPARPDAVDGRPRGRAELGRRLARPRPARLAHRVRGHRPRPPRHGLRRPGRRLRPRLPAPRDGRLARPGAHRRVPVSPRRTCTPAWSRCDGEKMSKSKGNLVFVSALRRDGVDPAAIRLALLAHHYRADWEWTDAGARGRRGAARHAGAPPSPGPTDRPPTRSSRRSARPSPTTWTPRRRWPPWTAGRRSQNAGGGTDEGAPGLVSRAVDALLGVAL